MAYTKEQLLEMYRKLPHDLQDAIFSVDTAEAIRAIGEKNKLMIDKIGELADETGLVMLGLSSPSQFIPHLSERLGVSRELAKTIGQEINEKIFLAIRESLKKVHGTEEVEAPAPPPSPTPPSIPTPLQTPPEAKPAGITLKPTTLGLPKVKESVATATPPPAVPIPTAPPAITTPPMPPAPPMPPPEIFRSPAQVVEKVEKVEGKKTDPYREPVK